MWVLNYARRLYSLDTLDTRFKISAKTPPAVTPQADPPKASQGEEGVNKRAVQSSGSSPSLWSTPEFYLYYAVIMLCVPLMFKSVYDVSKVSHPNYPKYESLLSPGWIFGRKVDNSDAQYASFRDNVPYMFLVLVLHPTLRKLFSVVYPLESQSTVPTTSVNVQGHLLQPALADARLNQRVTFDLYFALIFLGALHGFSAFKVLFILYLNFFIATKLPRRFVPLATWTFNISILFANELCGGYPYAATAKFILPWSSEDSNSGWGSVLDRYGGLIPRWEILFKITILRLISFNMDHCWSLGRSAVSSIEKKQLDPSNLSERDRVDIPAKPHDYSFRNYLAYTLYSPLYLAGPIITFNDYISQTRYASKSITTKRTVLYGIRFAICLLAMEFMLHYIYVVAISKAQPAWEVYTPFQLSMLGYFNLHIIWLKLLLPWRFFRFWSLLDGIDPPENMVRCMSNNYSAMAFWRGWHRSLNRWIVRYLYIPLGGSGDPKTKGKWAKIRFIANFLAVFTFVALWHDINMRLLAWGWLITLFVLPEVLAEMAFPMRKWQNSRNVYRWICGVGAVFNILMMMAANLVGFVVGLDGLKGLVGGIVGSYSGVAFLAMACAGLFVGVQVMFETRAQELREGIKMKC